MAFHIKSYFDTFSTRFIPHFYPKILTRRGRLIHSFPGISFSFRLRDIFQKEVIKTLFAKGVFIFAHAEYIFAIIEYMFADGE